MARTEKVTVYLEPETKAQIEMWAERNAPMGATLSTAINYVILKFLILAGYRPEPKDDE